MYVAIAVEKVSYYLIEIVDTKRLRVVRAWEVELGESLTFQQESDDRATKAQQKADHVTVIVDPSCEWLGSVGRNNGGESPGVPVELIGMGDTVAILVDANRDTLIVDAE